MLRLFRRSLSSNWYESTIIKDKQSKFQSRHVDLTNLEEIPHILTDLIKQNKSISKASHPHMVAWRVQQNNTTAIVHGFKDNGEKGAGTILLDILIKYDLVNVLIICTRWYGGKPIGGARFRHIKASATESLKFGDKIG